MGTDRYHRRDPLPRQRLHPPSWSGRRRGAHDPGLLLRRGLHQHLHPGNHQLLQLEPGVDTREHDLQLPQLLRGGELGGLSSPAHPYPTYPYVCPEMGYVQAPVDASQPTFAYCYQDAQGLQQIYYVAGPFIMPTHETSPLPMAEDLPSSTSPSSEDPSSEDPSDLSFSWSNDVESEESSPSSEEDQAEVDLDSKPAEEWTQEDYARYYGL